MSRISVFLHLAVCLALGDEQHWSVPLEADPDFPEYLKFLSDHRRSHSERRRLNSHPQVAVQ